MIDNNSLKGKILIIEDDTVLAKMYAKKFENDGFQVILVFSGREATIAVEREMPDVIVLDIMLPAIDGFTIIKNIKQNPKIKDIPIVILTNLGTSQIIIDEAKKLGVNNYLVKYKTATREVVRVVEESVLEKKN